MKKKYMVLCLMFLFFEIIYAQSGSFTGSEYEGTWVSANFINSQIDINSINTWVISIHQYKDSTQFLITAVSPSRLADDIFTFIAHGVLLKDGSIMVTTHKGFIWYIGIGKSAKYGKIISMWEKNSDWDQTLYPADVFPPISPTKMPDQKSK